MGSSMDVLEMAVMLSSLLLPASPLARDHQDLTTRNLNMTFDPREWKLSWECQENATNVACFMIHKEGPFKKKPEAKACHCTFSPLPLSDGVTFEVKMTINQSLFMGRLNYPNSGGEGTAPQNISCFIYDARFMNCTWEKGPAAPGDIQYFLYVRASEKEETECPHYRSDSGTHVACHFDDLQYLTFHNYFLVNGTSQQVGIQFSDLFLSLQEIERISPPANTSVTCNTSHCLIRWEKPRTYHRLSHWDLQYQLDIRQQGSEDGDDPKPAL
ncbi:granulocyte-macrophage colony-stimulating factor receptor subunit alpha isoform X2 [Dasypus novemcinctus]|uniref:granulocyte-macrophage colony-stimulating factor receptor subunit alpha isoform X2 n=1 Tax=Dasypus novemcinctus TaxID=9361 RepID=UPI0039C8C777